ncbi:RBBP9/YdeN family alpha/beta hydrolase [Ottowia sp. VDI28]|uniref:RBBP9/YdeN family alpha/beta hydrolase n=1 Tax=Ottowia sp. VDI28 TaxID=3133968 RepID=UPI003C2DD816
MSFKPTLLLVPGLRDEAPGHWQAILAGQWPGAVSLPALGRRNIDLAARLVQIEDAVQAIQGPVVLVAHSGGVIATVHWAQRTRAAIHGALLATPPLFAGPLGSEFPDLAEFQRHGWMPIPCSPLPFRSIVAASRNDPLGSYEGVSELAHGWGARLVDLGESGHLNPASGFGLWPAALELVRELALPAPMPESSGP